MPEVQYLHDTGVVKLTDLREGVKLYILGLAHFFCPGVYK